MNFAKLLQYCLYDRHLATVLSRQLGIALPKREEFNPEFTKALEKLQNAKSKYRDAIKEMHRTSKTFTEKKCTFEHAVTHHMEQDFLVPLNREMADLAVTFKEKLIVWNDSFRTVPGFPDHQTRMRMHQELIAIGTLTDWIIAYQYFKPVYNDYFEDMAFNQIISLLKKNEDEIPLTPPPALEIDPTYGYEFYQYSV
jgi:hypothetical protein